MSSSSSSSEEYELATYEENDKPAHKHNKQVSADDDDEGENEDEMGRAALYEDDQEMAIVSKYAKVNQPCPFSQHPPRQHINLEWRNINYKVVFPMPPSNSRNSFLLSKVAYTSFRMSSGKTVTLNTGHKIPQLGYGTWQAAPGEVGNGVYEALKIGYRHLDLAKIYENQKEVAQGIKRAFADIPGLKREDIFITSKLWNTQHDPAHVEAALDDTLAELELDYLDLYLIHWPVNFGPGKDPHSDLFPATADPNEVNIDNSIPNSETWKAVSKLPKSKARSVGVSNFTYQNLKALVEKTGLVPAVNQIERHPILPSKELIAYAKEKNIHITAYSAFGNNFFDIPLLITRPEVKAIAEKKGATPAQVILAWSQVGGHSVIPKSVTPARIAENFKEIELSDEDIAAIQKFSDEHQGRRRYNVPYTANKPRWSINIFDEPEEQEAPNKVVL